jgi:hypothetical protein
MDGFKGSSWHCGKNANTKISEVNSRERNIERILESDFGNRHSTDYKGSNVNKSLSLKSIYNGWEEFDCARAETEAHEDENGTLLHNGTRSIRGPRVIGVEFACTAPPYLRDGNHHFFRLVAARHHAHVHRHSAANVWR